MVEQHRSTSIMIFLTTIVLGGSLLLSADVQESLFTWWTVRLTELSGIALKTFGFAVRWHAQALATSDGSFTTIIGNGCNGAWAHLIFLASVLAYPATWKEKLLGLAVGQPLLLALNLVRVVSLFIIGVYAPAMFRAAHVYVWQFLIIGFAMLLLFIWADRFVERTA